MLRKGNKITVRYSDQLAQAGNKNLVGKTGIITKVMLGKGILGGVYADVKVFRKTKNFYIPQQSVESSEDINKARVSSLLKNTVL